jgi:hypothetical protein
MFRSIAYPHPELDSVLDFACGAFIRECSEVWVIDEQSQMAAELAGMDFLGRLLTELVPLSDAALHEQVRRHFRSA